MNIKPILLILILFFLVPFVNGESIGKFAQDTEVELYQTCDICTYCNLTSIKYPNSSNILTNLEMTKDKTAYNYSLDEDYTSVLGEYSYCYECGVSSDIETGCIDFEITSSGGDFGIEQAIMLLGFFGIIGLFLGIGLTFKKEKWKIRSFFFMIAIIFGIIFLNSIRIIIGTSSGLASMGTSGLIVGIVVLSVMFMYILVMYTIEIITLLNVRKKEKWKP